MRLIDADALMRRFMDKPPEYYHASYIVGEINTAPTIEERKTGKWIVYYHGGTWFSYECNLCRHSSMDRTPFCSYCGARMETENDIVEN